MAQYHARHPRTAFGTAVPAILLWFCVLIAAGCAPQTTDQPDAGPPRRVIWIAIDSLRADHLGMNGYPRATSPWLDEFAGQSVRFDWALSPSNETLLSVVAYFGGQPFSAMQDGPLRIAIPDRVETLAERLQVGGFRTRALTANPFIRPGDGFAQGFDEYEILRSPGVVRANLDEIIHRVRGRFSPGADREFVYIHTMDVHHPYQPRLPFGEMFIPEYAGSHVRQGSLVQNDRVSLVRSLHPYWSETHDVGQSDIDFLVGLYDGAIRYTDSKLAELLDALEVDYARDLVIITADHGEHFFEMGWWTHFATLTPMEIHVPFLVRYDAFPARQIDAPVGLVDLYPTILDLFNLEARTALAGASLLPVLRGDALPDRDVYAESAPRHGLSAALVDRDRWYWMYGNRTSIAPWHAWPYAEYLYDYRADPLGTRNLESTEREKSDAMNARLRESHPKWERFTRERLHGDDDHVEFGPNLLDGAAVETPSAGTVEGDPNRGWGAHLSTATVRYRVTGLMPYEPLYLSLAYTLESGSIRVSFTPAEFSMPSLADIRSVWSREFLKPRDEPADFGSTIVPMAESGVLEIQFRDETRATVTPPQLRRMQFDPIEPWVRLLGNEAQLDPELTPEEYERLKSLGYVGD